MNEFERELREMFKRHESDVLTPIRPVGSVARRTRRRQLGVVVTAVVVVVAIVVVPVIALRLGASGGADLRPAETVLLPDAPAGFHAAAVPYASIAYPNGWYLLDTSPLTSNGQPQPAGQLSSPILQLANFDPDIPHAPRCVVNPDTIPSSGVYLTVGVMTQEEASLSPPSGTWPAQLAPFPSGVDPCARRDASRLRGQAPREPCTGPKRDGEPTPHEPTSIRCTRHSGACCSHRTIALG
jgi:hypothetical protein